MSYTGYGSSIKDVREIGRGGLPISDKQGQGGGGGFENYRRQKPLIKSFVKQNLEIFLIFPNVFN